VSTTKAPKEKVILSGVSETALLTLNSRAREARRGDSVIDDPTAVALVDSIDFNFAKFGPGHHQGIALRALAFDTATTAYLDQHPSATVVALAEGFQTSFWRLDAAIPGGRFRWLTVDLAPIVDVRDRLLPSSPRVSVRAQSALDYSWMDSVDDSNGVFITAEGLLMYLQPEQALELIAQCAKRFPGAQMLFDLTPAWLSKLSQCTARWPGARYRIPPMPFNLSPAQAADLVNTVPGINRVTDLQMPAGRGLPFQAAISRLFRTPVFDPMRPCLSLLEFG
jgi:O-methyltransferase involved in polyketide biosynthesis